MQIWRTMHSNLRFIGAVVVLVAMLCPPALSGSGGVIEGFYWSQSLSVNGQFGSYSLSQRLQLLQLLKQNNVSFYVFAPQEPVASWNQTQASGWAQTAQLANSLGVKAVYGLRPGYIDNSSYAAATLKLQEMQTAGLSSYSLHFDDAAGAGTAAQQSAQVNLAASLQTGFPSMELFLFVPSGYRADLFASRSAWETDLITVDDGIDDSVPMAFTGLVTTPNSMDDSQFPALSSGRRRVFFDNWIAVDTNTRLPWGLIRNRAANLFTQPSNGYVLNLAYPLERVIHQLICLGQLVNGNGACNSTLAAQGWASWLNDNGFVHPSQSATSVMAALKAQIEADNAYGSIAALEAAYPALAGTFSTSPTVIHATPTGLGNSSPARGAGSPPAVGPGPASAAPTQPSSSGPQSLAPQTSASTSPQPKSGDAPPLIAAAQFTFAIALPLAVALLC